MDFTGFPNLVPTDLATNVISALGKVLPAPATVALSIGAIAATVGLVFALAWKGISKIRGAK